TLTTCSARYATRIDITAELGTTERHLKFIRCTVPLVHEVIRIRIFRINREMAWSKLLGLTRCRRRCRCAEQRLQLSKVMGVVGGFCRGDTAGIFCRREDVIFTALEATGTGRTGARRRSADIHTVAQADIDIRGIDITEVYT